MRIRTGPLARLLLAALLPALALGACVTPGRDWPKDNERDPAEVRAERRTAGMGGFFGAAAGFAARKL